MIGVCQVIQSVQACALNRPLYEIVLTVSELEEPPADFDGKVDAEEFWEKVSLEVICRGLVPSEYINSSCLVMRWQIGFLWKCTAVYDLSYVPFAPNLLLPTVLGNKENPFVVRPSYHHGLVLTPGVGM